MNETPCIPRSQWICTFPQKALDRPQPVQPLPYGAAGCPRCGAHTAGIFDVWRCCRAERCDQCGQRLDWAAHDAYHAARGNVWNNPDPTYAQAVGLGPQLARDLAAQAANAPC